MRGKLLPNAPYLDPNRGDNKRNSTAPVAPRGLNGAYMADGVTLGDWDTGIGTTADGPYINIADQASANKSQSSSGLYYAKGGYVNGAGVVESGASFSPNRQISSAVAFGSLPTGIDPARPADVKPWQTLLFCRNPLGGDAIRGLGNNIVHPVLLQARRMTPRQITPSLISSPCPSWSPMPSAIPSPQQAR